ncbi:MAG: double-strand break repair helicase AddA [Alphaproteobacteria bacterium]
MAGADLKQLTDANQARASDPAVSAWVSANAGTGKTTVLVNRVLRLLLHQDEGSRRYTAPEKILCLTYTKAAAAEMENRLFEILSKWAVKAEPDLAGALKDLRGQPATPQDMERARTLFATTLDTKGGLKIHTIHAFCERLLHRFPLEAGVQADFKVLEDSERRTLRDAAIDAVLTKALEEEGAPLGQALMAVIASTGEERFREIIEVTLGKQEELRAIHRLGDGSGSLGEEETQALRRLFGVSEARLESQVLEEMAGVLSDGQIIEVIAALRSGGKRDQGLADALGRVMGREDLVYRAAGLLEVFFRADGKTAKAESSMATKSVTENHPDAVNTLIRAYDEFCALAAEQAAMHIASSTGAHLTLADEIIDRYERGKAARAALDYDDLIARTVRLLGTSHAAQWVLYKLDYGIDHILVDEAQDTSPVQWRVIDALAEEFFTGMSAQEVNRTLFAVGDEKQSIYSFQGADPASFAEHGRKFKKLAEDSGRVLESVPLTVSFRSTAPVLKTVDDVFAKDGARDGVTWDGAAVVHQAVRAGQAGLVELWPVEEPEEGTPSHPMRPQEEKGAERHARDSLVERIANTIRQWLENGEQLDARNRAIRPGDILILVRSRDAFVPKLIRALKARQIPVAGADRMKLTEQLAVMDLMALAEFVLLPEDDLNLATLLKSPLIGFNDDDLFKLAYKREGALWNALRDKRDDDERYSAAVSRLSEWLNRADTMPPYEFFAQALEENQMQMRLALIARLGADAGDAIDEFLNLALDYERLSHPSLQGFLDAVRSSEADVKRDMEQGRDEVRIMTAHGAKGLEANVVFLPDTCRGVSGGGNKPRLLPLPRASAPPDAQGHLVWVPSGVMELEAIGEAKEILKEKDREEYNRLLYVAMTRARDRLYVCGWRGVNKPPKECWHNLVSAGLEGLARPATSALGQDVLRYECTQTQDPIDQESDIGGPPVSEPLPDWAKADASLEAPASLPLTPSSIPAPRDETGLQMLEQDVVPPLARADQSRFLRGNLVHSLLQYLPEIDPSQREAKARSFVASGGEALGEAECGIIVKEALAILEDPSFALLFGARSQAEVPIVARIIRRNGVPLEHHGQIDRLAVLDHEVLIVDYKTNRPPPEKVEDASLLYRRQLAVYRAAIKQLYPEKKVRAALLWTDGPDLMEIPGNLLDEAMEEIMTL